MAHVSLNAHIDAPVERVFALSSDFKRYPEWNVNYAEVLEITGPGDTVGTKIHAVGQVLGRKMESWYEIVEADPPRLLQMTTHEPSPSTTTTRLTPAGTGTDVSLEVEYELPAGIFGEIANKLFVERFFERSLRHAAENFKALVEAEAHVSV
jgi:uncharacterized membrane protein